MPTLLRILSALLPLLALAGCAATYQPPEPQGLLRDGSFKLSPQKIPAAAEILAPSPEMRAFVKDDPDFQQLLRRRGERDALIEALYSSTLLKLSYESSSTRNATEAFAARSGNCLSLVIMAAALAQELHLPVRFQSVFTEEGWSRSGGINFVAGHVNLTLGAARRNAGNTMSLIEPDQLVIDFVQPDALRGYRVMEIDKNTIIAMYYNNRAAETLETGDVDGAYWWSRAAVLQESQYLPGFNTLAVIYRRHGDAGAAEAVLREVLRREPANVEALSNLILVMRDQQRLAEADQIQARLVEVQPYPPFKFFDLGIEAMKAGEYGKARELFKREIARSAYYHEFHFWLALADYALGDPQEAGRQLALAVEYSPTRKTHDLYAAKLAWLELHDKPKGKPKDKPYVIPALPRGMLGANF